MTPEKPNPTDQSDFWVIGDLVDEADVALPYNSPEMPQGESQRLPVLSLTGSLLLIGLIVGGVEASGLTEYALANAFWAVAMLLVYELAYAMLVFGFSGRFQPLANGGSDGQSARGACPRSRSRP